MRKVLHQCLVILFLVTLVCAATPAAMASPLSTPGDAQQAFDQETVAPTLGNSVERPYDWYVAQGLGESRNTTGKNDCGPASVAMAIQFAKQEPIDIATLRSATYGNLGTGNFLNSHIEGALDAARVENQWYSTSLSTDDLIAEIDQGHPCICGLMMGDITLSPDDADGCGRYYSYSDRHVLIVKGYSSDKQWLQVYDPDTFENPIYYYDKTQNRPKGKDRWYSASEVKKAIELNGSGCWAIRPTYWAEIEEDSAKLSRPEEDESALHIEATIRNLGTASWVPDDDICLSGSGPFAPQESPGSMDIACLQEEIQPGQEWFVSKDLGEVTLNLSRVKVRRGDYAVSDSRPAQVDVLGEVEDIVVEKATEASERWLQKQISALRERYPWFNDFYEIVQCLWEECDRQ